MTSPPKSSPTASIDRTVVILPAATLLGRYYPVFDSSFFF